MNNNRASFFNRIWVPYALALLVFAIAAAVALSPTSYYMIRPGSAVELQPIVTVQGGKKVEKGTLMLTTVRMGPANVLGYLYAKADPHTDLIKAESVHSPNETDEQYNVRELEVMKHSQENAMIVAFRKAGLPVKVTDKGVMVMLFTPGMPAEKYLQVGDIIETVDGKKTPAPKDLLATLKGRKAGEMVKLGIVRNGQRKEMSLKLSAIPRAPGQKETRAGIGIMFSPSVPATKRTVDLPKEVTIHAESIGGPSAGMMFTLEILNQVTGGDITKGYRIAGTGEMFEDGTVGRIGGIEHKIQAADKTKADIFLAPNDVVPPGAGYRSNYEEAQKAANELGTSMKVVPVRTIDDAIRYLRSLPPKK
jgi:Lon-like protease